MVEESRRWERRVLDAPSRGGGLDQTGQNVIQRRRWWGEVDPTTCHYLRSDPLPSKRHQQLDTEIAKGSIDISMFDTS